MKILFRFLTLVFVFVALWFSLSQVNWMRIFHVEEVSESMEKKLTELVKESIERSEEIILDEEVKSVIDSIIHKITKQNYINASELNVLVVQNPQINAFALPDNHLVIYSGLIEACESPEALSGVLAHEIAHIELNHVMKKLVKEVGLSVLFSLTSNGGGEVLKQVSKTLSSSSYDRSLEEEADQQALIYLLKAKIDPQPLAEFFFQLSLKEPEFVSKLGWLSTHPDSKQRAEDIIQEINDSIIEFEPVISQQSWNMLKNNLESHNSKEL